MWGSPKVTAKGLNKGRPPGSLMLLSSRWAQSWQKVASSRPLCEAPGQRLLELLGIRPPCSRFSLREAAQGTEIDTMGLSRV